MQTYVVKGTTKIGIRPLAGVTFRIFKDESSGETIVGGPATTDGTGAYRIQVDLDPASRYKVKWEHASHGSKELPLVLAPKPGMLDNTFPVILFSPSFQTTTDPFVQYKNQISRGRFIDSETSGTDFFHEVEISDAVGTSGPIPSAQVRGQLTTAAPKDTWTKDFDEVRHQLVRTPGGLRWKSNTPPADESASAFDLTENNRSAWDWITWETEGNSDPKYQRGGKLRKLGLYKLDYDKLRKAGKDEKRWKPVHTDHTTGGGWVKVATLECMDYSSHGVLIKTFLPCFRISGGKVLEPPEWAVPTIVAPLSVTVSGSSAANAVDIAPPVIILPFNYDDNGGGSRALGKDLGLGVFCKDDADAKRLEKELERWATASRSTITAFRDETISLTPKTENTWPLRPASASAWKPQVLGTPTERTLREYQGEGANASVKYYSVKTGVQYVATVDQSHNSKDLLEENSIHAMNRSNLIKATMQRVGEGKFEGRYQIEILCILIQKNPKGDEHFAAHPDELENPADKGAEVTDKRSQIAGLVSLGEEAKSDEIVKLQREIAEILKPGDARIKDLKSGIGWDGIQVREISNAGASDIWFPALAIPSHGKAFVESWAAGQDWKKFWELNFAAPLGRAKAEMLLYFGMQHMTSNSQNFLIAFDRSPGGPSGKLKHIILRDIGDTLYNDHVFAVLKEIDGLYAKEWDHESADPFGVTLASSLGSYTMPRMLRIGASIVFFFEPFVKCDIEKLDDCADVLSKWSIAHNRAFVNYMKEKIGYKQDWSPGPDTVDPSIREAVSKYCELIKQNDIKYKFLVPKILALNSSQRWLLIAEFERLLDGITKLDEAKRLVNAHEVLICADIQKYIQSDTGKSAIRAFHAGSVAAPRASSPPRAPAAALTCSKCGSVSSGGKTGWQKCGDCGKHYCPKCVAAMEKPIGFKNPIYVNRKCTCGGITDIF